MFRERLRADVRGSIRLLRYDPIQSLLTIAVLSLGVGASLAVFAAVDFPFLRPLPFPDDDQLVVARMSDNQDRLRCSAFSVSAVPEADRGLEPS